MAIDSLNSLSTEQLLALTTSGNGQLTGSDSSSSGINESDIAFQTVMDNMLNSSKNSNTSTSSTNDISAEQLMAMSLMSNGQLTSSDDSSSSESKDMSNQMTLANALMMKSVQESAKSSNDTKNSAVQQDCPTGQDLEKLAMMVNERGADYSNYISNNATPADMEKIYAAVDDASKKYGVNKDLILAVIKQESNFDSTAVSSAGTMGLMQIMPFNFSSLGISDPYDVNQNVNGGTQLLKQNLDKYNGNIDMALMAYNAGSGTMQKRGVASENDLYKMPAETQNYVPSVLKYYKSGV